LITIHSSQFTVHNSQFTIEKIMKSEEFLGSLNIDS
jgi:hypothetical protein